ncbi:hypothetical protein SAMN05216302_101317 [Nitrosomonas aestuarii]|uniref:Uncharacterized protein n=1 Tax=Nitrosomonas aestuarii TaxID=52441 RepID=A0A1I4BQI5_9PROT|nr:hypothetical protein SAMN05216302_101317 [Nitrosomonas aestuarii]
MPMGAVLYHPIVNKANLSSTMLPKQVIMLVIAGGKQPTSMLSVTTLVEYKVPSIYLNRISKQFDKKLPPLLSKLTLKYISYLSSQFQES